MHPTKGPQQLADALESEILCLDRNEQPICREVLLEKYAKDKEQTVGDVRARVARALAAAEREDQRAHWERRFYEAMEAGFIPAGRINSAAGIPMQATLINCFVQPVGDSISEVVDGKPGIYSALQEAAETMRRGGGVGYDTRGFFGVNWAGLYRDDLRKTAARALSMTRLGEGLLEVTDPPVTSYAGLPARIRL